MPISNSDLWALARLTVEKPVEAGERIRALDLPRNIGWMVLILAGVASAVLTGLSDLLVPPQPVTLESGEVMTPPRMSPLLWGIVSVASAALLTAALWRIGGMMGGQAGFTLMLNLMAWLQLFMVLVLALQVLLILLAPPLSFLAMLAGLVISFRAMAHFVNLAHGFDSLGRSTGVIVLSFLAISVALVLFLMIFGIGAGGIAPSGAPQ
jgi:hypothetical protein